MQKLTNQRLNSKKRLSDLERSSTRRLRVNHIQHLRRRIAILVTMSIGSVFACFAIVQMYRHIAIGQLDGSSHRLSEVTEQHKSTGAVGSNTLSYTNAPAIHSHIESSSSAKPESSQLPTREEVIHKMMKQPLPTSALIHVPPQSQHPELKNGCEVTSLSMLLSYLKHPMSKMTLAEEEPKDNTPLMMKGNQIVSWGNPNVGFVGSVKGDTRYGFGIYHGPLTKLVNKIVPKRGLDLTGISFRELEAIVAGGTPVEVWTTYTFRPTYDWCTWQTPEGPIRVTMQEHAVLLVGFDQNDVYINNPGNGKAGEKVPLKPFIEAWKQLGQQAITISPDQYATS